MPHLLKTLVLAASLCLGCLLPSPAHAQMIIWGGEAERGLRPGPSNPYDGAPIMERYNYGTGSFFYPINTGNMDARRLNYLDYADKLDRAYKFGYAPPRDPFTIPQAPPSASRPRVGLGLFRWR